MTGIEDWPPKQGQEVFIQKAEGHELPALLEGLELPAKGRVVEEAEGFGPEFAGQLWWVQLSEPLTEKVQVHRDQLRPVNCPECGCEPGIHNIACKLARREREARSGKEPAAGWTSDAMLATLLHRTLVSAGSGRLGLALKDDGNWVVSAEYGHEEDEGEPTGMVGAATYGTGELRHALMQAGADAGLWIDDGSPEPGERQQRILIVEARHPAEMNENAVQGSMTLLADADEAYAFFGDKAVCLKHRGFDVSEDAFQVAVAIQRRLEQSHEQVPAKARADVLRRIRDLAPHEITCTCSHGGEFDMTVHDDGCPRRQLAHVLTVIEAK